MIEAAVLTISDSAHAGPRADAPAPPCASGWSNWAGVCR